MILQDWVINVICGAVALTCAIGIITLIRRTLKQKRQMLGRD